VGETARYLYAISRHLAPEALAGAGGLMGAPLEVVSHRGLDAVVSDVPLSEFGELALKENLESLSWLERVARGHDDVVNAAAAAGPVAPMRLATICLDDEGVRARLDEWHEALNGVLDRVEGRAEWSVKVLMPPAAPATAATSAAGSGVAYLQQKRAQQQEREQRLASTSSMGEEIHRDLARITVASRLLSPQDPQLTRYAGTMVLNGAYLVDIAAGDHFERRVRELAAAHPDARIESAGPWPPYSFAVLEQT
jgi:hypothetical protein